MTCSADYGSPAVITDWAVEPEDMVDGDHPEQHGYSIPCLALSLPSVPQPYMAAVSLQLINLFCSTCRPVPVQQSTGNSLPWAVAVKMVKM